jgi:hypothetical protein
MTTTPTHLFGPADVLDLFRRQDGVHLPEVSARASVHTDGTSGVVELASQLDIDCERAPERFRVTVERIEGAPAPAERKCMACKEPEACPDCRTCLDHHDLDDCDDWTNPKWKGWH